MLPISIRLVLLAVLALRLSLGPVYAAPHALRQNERDISVNARRSSVLGTRQIAGIIDAITGAGEAGSDAAKVAKGTGSAKASKSTKSEAKQQNQNGTGSTPHAVLISPGIDIREISDADHEQQSEESEQSSESGIVYTRAALY